MQDTKPVRPWHLRSWFLLPQLLFMSFPWLSILLMWIGKRYHIIVRLGLTLIAGWFSVIFWQGMFFAMGQLPNYYKNAYDLNTEQVDAPQSTITSDFQNRPPSPLNLSLFEKKQKITECNQRYVDSQIKDHAKNQKANFELQIDEFKKSLTDPNYIPKPQQPDPQKTALDESLRHDSVCYALYYEIFSKNMANQDQAYAETDAKFQDNGSFSQFSAYEEKLNKKFLSQLLLDYGLARNQYSKIDDLISPYWKAYEEATAQDLREKLSVDSVFEDSLMKLEVFPQTSGGQMVRVAFKGSNVWSAKMTKYDILSKTMDFTKKVFNDYETKEVLRIEFRPYILLGDKYGNEELSEVGIINIDREFAEKINWEHMYVDQFEKIIFEDTNNHLHKALYEN